MAGHKPPFFIYASVLKIQMAKYVFVSTLAKASWAYSLENP
jgi:hypothetical protein